jgi:hypothetical protein
MNDSGVEEITIIIRVAMIAIARIDKGEILPDLGYRLVRSFPRTPIPVGAGLAKG